MNPSYPPGFTQREHDARFSPAKGFTPHDFDCPICKREVTEDARDLFYMDGRLIEPLDTSDGELVCSGACKSQYEFDRLCPADQDAARDMARAAYAWWMATGQGELAFKLAHGAVAKLVPAIDFGAAEMGVKDVLKSLAGEEFLDSDEGPAWFEKAVGLINEPLLMPVRAAQTPFSFADAWKGGAR